MAVRGIEKIHTLVGVWGRLMSNTSSMESATINPSIRYQRTAESHNEYRFNRTWEQCRGKNHKPCTEVQNGISALKIWWMHVQATYSVRWRKRIEWLAKLDPRARHLDATLGNRAALGPLVVMDSGTGRDTVFQDLVVEDEGTCCTASISVLLSFPRRKTIFSTLANNCHLQNHL